jgi:hypothetical protein
MDNLPLHGRVDCTKCFAGTNVDFDKAKLTDHGWRITANPLAWGNPNCEIVVLGFSKGPTQAGAVASTPHDEIAYKGSRQNVGKILSHIGVLPASTSKEVGRLVSEAIADKSGRFHFGSLIRCTVERYDDKSSSWKGSGGGMLDKFVGTSFGQSVAKNCTERFLGRLPSQTKLVVMFGLGSKLNYVQESFKLYQAARGGTWKWVNDAAYSDGKIVVVHVEHFASQGALIPQWLGQVDHQRSRLGKMAQTAVQLAFQ